MDSFNELKLQVVEALRSKGVLGSIKVSAPRFRKLQHGRHLASLRVAG